MASVPTGQKHMEEEEEAFSIKDFDSEEVDPEQTLKTVSKTSIHKTHVKTSKAQGTPPPTGHGLTRKIGDRASAPEKGTHVSKSSDSGRDTGTEQTRPRVRAISAPRERHRTKSAPRDQYAEEQKSVIGTEKGSRKGFDTETSGLGT
ncbi:hypothetical protein NDU88_000660 [Pleurodeles waltl]|uniref:Uncharacterized protein n=1 Tax=Pleurodeles waltl TaxID=8319 RepID=A0AAV7R8G8_PLEWA|nr:hypothetical protein NDU88_000660 [Pleurodeles waltl]